MANQPKTETMNAAMERGRKFANAVRKNAARCC